MTDTDTSPASTAEPRGRRRRYILAALAVIVLALACSLGYYWLKPAPPPRVSVELNQEIFSVTKTDLRGQTLQNALTKVAYPQSVFSDHVGDVWVVDASGGPSRTIMAMPEDTSAWTVVAVCFRSQTLDEIAANDKLAAGQKPAVNFVVFGVQRSDTVGPEQLAGLVQGTLDDTLPGCSFGVSGMTALRPGTGPTIRVQ
ncbi:hypothetical protein [Nocardia sp. XZ_19_369]|uniref:hypothetical protein n=1 Tax=Nocardia sp. XZ_19_369 TaxID=2769487 RepID=UPI00188E721B|nr:hypothetical protein [Nocardia sp. XZ_19_369]